MHGTSTSELRMTRRDTKVFLRANSYLSPERWSLSLVQIIQSLTNRTHRRQRWPSSHPTLSKCKHTSSLAEARRKERRQIGSSKNTQVTSRIL